MGRCPPKWMQYTSDELPNSSRHQRDLSQYTPVLPVLFLSGGRHLIQDKTANHGILGVLFFRMPRFAVMPQFTNRGILKNRTPRMPRFGNRGPVHKPWPFGSTGAQFNRNPRNHPRNRLSSSDFSGDILGDFQFNRNWGITSEKSLEMPF